jgi:hypothetical protein
MNFYRVLPIFFSSLIIIMIPIIHFYYIPSPAMLKSGLKTDVGIYTKGKRGKYLPKALIIGAPKCGNYILFTSIYH